jgi:transposase
VSKHTTAECINIYGLVSIYISDGKLHDVNVLDLLQPEPGSFYVMDRAYTDFERLYQLQQESAFFVIRAKSNLQFRRLYSHPVDKDTGLLCDQTVVLTGFYTAQHYPDKLRRIKYYDTQTNRRLVFLTNNFSLPALTIAELYRYRWQIELFFKWIKQHLRIKSFFGTSENAVKTQVWIAVSVYVLVAIIKKRLNIKISLYSILQILSLTVFETTPIDQLLTRCDKNMSEHDFCNQLNLFD